MVLMVWRSTLSKDASCSLVSRRRALSPTLRTSVSPAVRVANAAHTSRLSRSGEAVAAHQKTTPKPANIAPCTKAHCRLVQSQAVSSTATFAGMQPASSRLAFSEATGPSAIGIATRMPTLPATRSFCTAVTERRAAPRLIKVIGKHVPRRITTIHHCGGKYFHNTTVSTPASPRSQNARLLATGMVDSLCTASSAVVVACSTWSTSSLRGTSTVTVSPPEILLDTETVGPLTVAAANALVIPLPWLRSARQPSPRSLMRIVRPFAWRSTVSSASVAVECFAVFVSASITVARTWV